MPGVYYPLTAQRGSLKLPTSEAFLIPSDDGMFYGIQQGDLYQTHNPQSAIEFITNLPNGTWIITYDTITWVSSFLGSYLHLFTRIETIGDYQCTIVQIENRKIFIIDLFQATNDSLRNAAKKMGIIYSFIDQGLEIHLQSKITALVSVWYKYLEATSTAWGIYPSKTTGATALKAWRATLPEEAEFRVRGKTINMIGRAAIRPGGLNWREGYYPKAYSYDINGSYIHAMRTIPLPTSVICFSNNQPYDRWIATVKLNYKTNLHWGVLPVRSTEGKLYRPIIIEDYITTITYMDYYLLQLTGEVEITQWQEGITWKPENEDYLFTPWINGLLLTSQQQDYKYLLKNVSRSLHSKFAQSSEGKYLFLLQPQNKDEVLEYADRKELKDLIITPNGVVIMQIEKPYPKKFVPFLFPHWEALILATGRMQLYSNIDQNTIYVDTDSIISTKPRHDLSLSTECGNWKLEAEGETAIVGARSYVCGNKVKCAGVRATTKKSLKDAIISAARGMESEVTKIEYGNLIKQTKTELVNHSIKTEKYPYVELKQNTLFVTRSPTIEIPARQEKRLFSFDK